jgi:hypothetical protein
MSCIFNSSFEATECNRNFAEGNLKVKFQSRDSNKEVMDLCRKVDFSNRI